jgi:spermidine synthase
MRAPLARLLPLVCASGACALVYQIAWTRDFRLIFGASTPASAAVVAIFVGGLGLGAWKLGALVERTDRPLRVYARLELGIALSSAATPWLLALATRLYVALGGTVALGTAGATLARLLLASLVLATPTVLMGGTLPAVARTALAHDGDASRGGVGLLYGVNTLGAVGGCLLANFSLLEHLGTHATLWLAAAVNLLVSLAAWWMARSLPDAPAPGADAAVAPSVPAAAPARFVLAAAAVAGFAFFLMELVFYRMLIPLLGGTVYTFGLVLAVALLGMGLGGALYAALFGRREPDLGTFATTCLLEAGSLAIPYALGDRIALLAMRVRPAAPLGLGSYLAGWLAITALVVLPASIATGVQFPMLVALLGRGRREVARHVGLTYAWNTLGAIAGAMAGGFGLMPLLGAPGCWRLAVASLVVAGLAAAVLGESRERRLGLRSLRHWRVGVRLALVAGVASLVVASRGPTGAWRHSPIGVGRVDPANTESTEAWTHFARYQRRDVAWDADGIESSVALHQAAGYSFTTNGKSDGHCIYDAGTQVMGGLLGALLHPAPRSALVIGLGSGSTAGWLGRVPTLERVDVVELEPAMLQVARRCAPVNEHALDNPRLHVAIGDAREVLAVTRDRYDIVFSEPSNPYRAGVASLYTREYYRRVLDHLTDGGIFLQWVQGYEIDSSTMRTVFATVASEFPYVEAWQAEEPDLVLVASRTPLVKDVAALRTRVATEPFAKALRATWGVEDLEGVLAHFVARPSLAASIAKVGADPLNTDDRPVVEFGFARVLSGEGARDRVGVPTVRAWARLRGEDLPEVTGGELDWDRLLLEQAEIPCFDDNLAPYEARPGASEDVKERLDFDRSWLSLDEKAALAAWDRRERAAVTRVEALYLTEAAIKARDPRALGLLRALEATHPLEAKALEAQWLADGGHTAEAASTLEAALVGYRSDPWASSDVMSEAIARALSLADADHALAPRMMALLAEPFVVEMGRERRITGLIAVARSVEAWRTCADAYAQLEPDTPWSKWELQERLDCYRSVGDARAGLAEREAGRFTSEAATR